MAKFKQQVIEKFGDAQSFFRAIDVHRINKVRVDDFLERCDTDRKSRNGAGPASSPNQVGVCLIE